MGTPVSGVERPERSLSSLVQRELGVSINEQALRIFIRANWREVQGLAHAIHGTKQPE